MFSRSRIAAAKSRRNAHNQVGKRNLHLESLERRQLLAELASIGLEVTTLAGTPVSTLAIGQEYYLKAYVQDTREVDAEGVTAAFFDVAVNDNGLLSIEDQPGALSGLLFSPEYPLARIGTNLIETLASEFDEVGAATLASHGSAQTPFFQVKFTADAEGELTFTTNPADLLGNLFVLQGHGTIDAEDIVFGSVTVNIESALDLVDDAITIAEDTPDTTIDVLANDLGGAGVWTIDSIADISNGGDVQISGDGKTLVYTPAADFYGQETFRYLALDENGVVGEATVTITVTPQNDKPVNQVPDAVSFDATTGEFVFDADHRISTSDVDLAGGNLRVTLFVNKGTISLGSTSGLTFLNSSANNTRYLLFDGSAEDVEAALLNLTYTANNGVNSDVLTFDVHDLGNTGKGGAGITRDTIALTRAGVGSENHPPVNIVPPTQFFTNGDRTVTFGPLTPIQVTDPDVTGDLKMRVTLFAGHGNISLSQTSGLTFLNGSANNSKYLLFDGAKEDINAALMNMTYTADSGATSDLLTIDTHDLGNTGTGGAKVDRDVVALKLFGVGQNLPPVNITPLTSQFFTDSNRTITFGPLNRIGTFDPDAGDKPVRVTLFANHGVISLSTTSGLTFLNGANDSKYLLFDGTLEAVNNAMLNMTYTADPGATSDLLTIDTHDLGNTGTGGAKVDRDTVSIQLAGSLPNLSPVNVVPPAQIYTEPNATITFGALNPIATFDADAGNDDLRVTLFVNHGTINLSTVEGLTFLNGSSNNSRYLLFDGTLTEINNALRNMTYTANPNFSSDLLTIDTHDLGHNGSGGAKVDRDTVAITRVGTLGRFSGGGSGEPGSAAFAKGSAAQTDAAFAEAAVPAAAIAAIPPAAPTLLSDSASRFADLLASSTRRGAATPNAADDLFAQYGA